MTVDLTPGPAKDQERSDEKIAFTREDVEAGIQSLIDNEFIDLDRDDMDEIVRLVLTYATKGVREAAYRAGREDAAKAIETADTSGWPGGRGSDVDGCQERAAQVARGQHPRTPGEDVTP